MRKAVLFIQKNNTLYATVPLCILRNLGDIKSTIKQNKYVILHPCFKQQCLQMVSINNFENTGRKLKPDHLICCIYVFIKEAGFFSINDPGEKGNKLTEQILINFLPL